jgi:hypothetical protein
MYVCARSASERVKRVHVSSKVHQSDEWVWERRERERGELFRTRASSQGVMLSEMLGAAFHHNHHPSPTSPFARPPAAFFQQGGVRSSRIQSTIPPCAVPCLVDCLQPPCWAFHSMWHQHIRNGEKGTPPPPTPNMTTRIVVVCVRELNLIQSPVTKSKIKC